MVQDIRTAIALGQVGQAGQGARRNRAMADRLLAGATDGQPLYSPGAVLAKALTGGVAGFMAGRADAQEKDERRQAIADALSGQETQRQQQRDEVARVTQGTTAPGDYGPNIPALEGPARMDALAQMAPYNPVAQAQISTDQRREDQEIRARERAEQQAFQQQQLALQRASLAARQQPQPTEFDRMLAAAGIQPGSPEAQQLARAVLERRGMPPQTNVNLPPQVGSIPPGFQLTRDGETLRMEPIPGGPAARTVERENRADTARTTQQQRQGDLVVQEVDRILERMDNSWFPVTGAGGSFLSRFPGTAARDVAALLDTIRAESAFGRLQQMREASPTGGALGAVTQQELDLLKAAQGSLEQSQGAQQFRDNLNRLRNIYLDIVHGPGHGPPRARLSFDRDAPPDPGAPNVIEYDAQGRRITR